MKYYIDPNNGNDSFDGFSPETARRSYKDLPIKAGDFVLFKRGSFTRGTLDRVSGENGNPVTYGAYGDGNQPVFCGSVDVSSAENWTEVRPNIWQLTKELNDEVANFIYDNGRIGATLRWSENDLSSQGDWFDNTAGRRERKGEDDVQHKVLVFSKGNPSEVYSHIECAVWGARLLSQNKNHTVCEDLCFFGSGVHALSGCCRDMTVRRCSFLFIGGAVWNNTLRIRFGNAIEFWEYGENILIEDCYFNNIYDSAITEQGTLSCEPAKIVMRNNLFINYGMGAYEGRDVMLVDSVFEDNICLYAGGGFSAFGDTKPRNSEIYPRPMGHHLFMWRIPKAADGGGFKISRNLFYEATGGAMYSICSADADAQMHLDSNKYYTSNKELLNRFNGKNYPDFESYMSDCGENGAEYVENIDISAVCEEWFKKSGCGRDGAYLFTDNLPARKYFTGGADNALSYKVGDDIVFNVRLTCGGVPMFCPQLKYKRNGDDGVCEEGVVNGGTLVYHTSLSCAGYVHLIVTACDENGEPLPECDVFEGGACANFDEIRKKSTEPADFDEFWANAIATELDPVKPVLLEQREFASGDPGDVVYDVKITCAGKYPVSGYLRLPRDAAEGELPIIVEYLGYGVSSAPVPNKNRAIQLSLNQHGIKNGEKAEYYNELFSGEFEAFGFNREENRSPDTVYFKNMIFRALQAVRYCKTLSLWDGKNVTVRGSSMGAMQAIAVAAHDSDVTKLVAWVPWFCDLRGSESGRVRGWIPEMEHGLDYYDTVSQGARVKCKTEIIAGLGDYTCPPSGITSLYHAINAKTHMTMLQNKTHPYTAPEYDSFTVEHD